MQNSSEKITTASSVKQNLKKEKKKQTKKQAPKNIYTQKIKTNSPCVYLCAQLLVPKCNKNSMRLLCETSSLSLSMA